MLCFVPIFPKACHLISNFKIFKTINNFILVTLHLNQPICIQSETKHGKDVCNYLSLPNYMSFSNLKLIPTFNTRTSIGISSFIHGSDGRTPSLGLAPKAYPLPFTPSVVLQRTQKLMALLQSTIKWSMFHILS